MRILAIDPGYDRLGIAVVEGSSSRPTLLMSACVTPPRGERAARLSVVAKAVTDTIAAYAPDALAIETLFFGINKKTALSVAEARGAVLAAAGACALPVIECSPQEVKLAVTGHGRADKTAVARMIARLVPLEKKRRLDDELDAIGIGITALALARPNA